MKHRHISRMYVLLVAMALGALLLDQGNPLWSVLAPQWHAAQAVYGANLTPPTPVPPPIVDVSDPHRPSLNLQIAVDPDPVIVGQSATITVTVTNGAPDAANNLVVSLPAPAGASPQAGAITQAAPIRALAGTTSTAATGTPTGTATGTGTATTSAPPTTATGTPAASGTPMGTSTGTVSPTPTTGWTWTQAQLGSGASATFTATVTFNTAPSTGVLLAQLSATADRLPQPVTFVSGARVIDPAKAIPATAAFAPGSSATLKSADGAIEVQMPGSAAASPLSLRYDTQPPSGENAPLSATMRRGFGTFSLTATDSGGSAVHQFVQPVTLTLHYTDEQLAALHIAEGDLALYWYDPNVTITRPDGSIQQGNWILVETQVDAATHTAQATVDHFTGFQFSDGEPASAAYIPSLAGWQVSTFTGAASYSMPIEVPAGPNGIKPNVALTYNSSQTDGRAGMRPYAQAGWVGKGWNLDTGFIAARDSAVAPATYTIVLNGETHELVDIGNGDYRTSDESFLKVRELSQGTIWPGNNNDPRYKWVAWAKDGTRYEFTNDLWWGLQKCNNPAVGDWAYLHPYKWQLTSVTDTHGNQITYTYHQSSISAQSFCAFRTGTIILDSWPYSITWGRNVNDPNSVDRYQVLFISDTARAGDGTYDTSLVVNMRDGQYHLFGDTPHETRALRQLRVFSMQSTSWQLVRQYNFILDDFHLQSDSIISPYITSSNKLSLNAIQIFGKDLQFGSDLTVAGNPGTWLPAINLTYGLDNTLTSVGGNNYARGDWNRLIKVDNGQGGTVTFEYENIGQVTSTFNFQNNRRVTKKTVTDGRGSPPSIWQYSSYTNPELNWPGTNVDPNGHDPKPYPNSAALYFDYRYTTDHGASELVAAPRTEFRGHAMVQETLPDNTVIKHYFFQGDECGCTPTVTGSGSGITPYDSDSLFRTLRDNEFRRGREYKTELYAATTGVLLTRTEHTFGVTSVNYSIQAVAGIWNAFVHEDQTIETIAEGDANSTTRKTTTMTYDAYGNLASRTESDGASLSRTTSWAYNVRDSANQDGTLNYLVDRPYEERVTDALSNVLGLKHMLYDSLSGPGVGALGELTLVRAYDNVPAIPNLSGAQLTGRDESYLYDPYGNRTYVTTYTGRGTTSVSANGTFSFSPPGNGSTARTTTTAYDTTFHAFPTQVTSPLGLVETAGYDYQMGLLNAITGPNGAATTANASYDPLGRLLTIYKPGDDAIHPTLTLAYHNYNELGGGDPTWISSKQKYNATDSITSTHWFDGMGRKIQEKREVPGSPPANLYTNRITDTVYDALGRVTQVSQPHDKVEIGDTHYTLPPIDGSVHWTTTTYDSLGRPLVVTSPAPELYTTQTSYGKTATTQTVTTIDANGHKSVHESDLFGRLVKVTEYTGNSSGTYAVYSTTNYTYNLLDWLSVATDAGGHQTTLIYDTLGRKTSITDPDLGTWGYQYDPNGNLTQQTDTKGQVIGFGYDAEDRLIAKSGGVTASYYYDDPASTFGLGHRTGMSNGSTMLNGSVTSNWRYDARGRTTQEATTIQGVQKVFAWAYDSGDRITSLTYPDNETISYTYDFLGRPLSACSSVGGLCYANNATYTVLDQPQNVTLGNNVTESWTYAGGLQRLARHQVGSGIFDRRYTMDPVGNIASITDNFTLQVENFTYDERDRLKHAWTTGSTVAGYDESDSYDALGNFVNKGSAGYAYPGGGATNCPNITHAHAPASVGGAVYQYDCNGNLTSEAQSGRSYTWNAENLPTAISTITLTPTTVTPTQPLRPLPPTVTPSAGNPGRGGPVTPGAVTPVSPGRPAATAPGGPAAPILPTRPDNLPPTVTPNPISPRAQTDDEPFKILAVPTIPPPDNRGGGAGTLSAALDPAHPGNISLAWQTDDGLAGQVFVSINGAPELTTALPQGSYGPITPGAIYKFTLYQGTAHTTSLAQTTVATTTETYSYDADGTRVSRTAGGVTTLYFGGMWEQEIETKTTRAHYTFGGQVVAQRETKSGVPTVVYLHSDHLGSVSVATNATGGVLDKAEYGPWGNIRSGGVSETTLNYTGQRRDGTGLLYYGARYYDPVLGRFLSPDSIGVNSGDPQSLNRYAYVLNNPLLRVDLTGHTDCSVLQNNCNNPCNQPNLICGSCPNQTFGCPDVQVNPAYICSAAEYSYCTTTNLQDGSNDDSIDDMLSASRRGNSGKSRAPKSEDDIAQIKSRFPDFVEAEQCLKDPDCLKLWNEERNTGAANQEKIQQTDTPFGVDAHHIVPVRERGAERARVLLAKFGISINSGKNIAYLKPGNHSNLEGLRYAWRIDGLIVGAYQNALAGGADFQGVRQALLTELGALGNNLENYGSLRPPLIR